MKRVAPILLVTLFLAGIFVVPAGVSSTPARLQETSLDTETLKNNQDLSWLPSTKSVRVAVYNTTNATAPTYVNGAMELDNSWIISVLNSAGYLVTEINLQDIQNHELQTRNYDVLVLADLVPNENITNLVKEFWLGGGGILATDTAGEYLNYAGIVPREAAGTNGYMVYWDYIWQGNFNVSTRHPVTKSYQLDEGLNAHPSYYFMWDMSALTGTSLNGHITELVEDRDTPNNAKAIAVDPVDMGGKTVHIGIPTGYFAPTGWNDMLVDAIEWLCPRPKGRILFDLTHQPYYGVDPWDAALCVYDTKYQDWRASLVNISYTFDKLWPSAIGNLTAENLQDYDMLIALCPGLNYTSAEVQAVMNWVSAGGGLLAFGEQNSVILQDYRENINYLLHSVGLQVNDTNNVAGILDTFAIHPMLESVTQLAFAAAGVVDTSGEAFPLVTSDNGDVFAGAQEYTNGRIVLINDINVFDVARLYQNDNRQFAVNIANWLTAGDVLVFAGTGGGSNSPNYPTPYRGPLATALNELGMLYYMTSSLYYFNLSLTTENWDLIAFDMPSGNLNAPAYYMNILDYLKGGGKAVLSSWQMNTAAYPILLPLWDYVGVSYAGNAFNPPPTIYVWDSAHPIFNAPTVYGADNFTTTWNYVTLDCMNLTLHTNATSIAGLGSSQSTTNASIALGAGGRVITNGMLVSAYNDDTDDSTYSDAVELWCGEIAYLMRPAIDAPADMVVEFGSVGSTITWTPQSDRPHRYTIERNSVETTDVGWDGGPISILLDGYALGTYTFKLTVYDGASETATDTVVAVVRDTIYPASVDAPDNLFYQEGISEHWMNWSFTELLPDSYWLLIDNVTVESGNWDGSQISVDVGGLSEGVYNVTLAVNDTSANVASSSVVLTVAAATTTSSTTTTTTTTTAPPTETGSTSQPPGWGDNTILILMAIAGIAVVVIIVVILSRRRK